MLHTIMETLQLFLLAVSGLSCTVASYVGRPHFPVGPPHPSYNLAMGRASPIIGHHMKLPKFHKLAFPRAMKPAFKPFYKPGLHTPPKPFFKKVKPIFKKMKYMTPLGPKLIPIKLVKYIKPVQMPVMPMIRRRPIYRPLVPRRAPAGQWPAPPRRQQPQPVRRRITMPRATPFRQPQPPAMNLPRASRFPQPQPPAMNLPRASRFPQPQPPVMNLPPATRFPQPRPPARNLPRAPRFPQPQTPVRSMPRATPFLKPQNPAMNLPNFHQPQTPPSVHRDYSAQPIQRDRISVMPQVDDSSEDSESSDSNTNDYEYVDGGNNMIGFGGDVYYDDDLGFDDVNFRYRNDLPRYDDSDSKDSKESVDSDSKESIDSDSKDSVDSDSKESVDSDSKESVDSDSKDSVDSDSKESVDSDSKGSVDSDSKDSDNSNTKDGADSDSKDNDNSGTKNGADSDSKDSDSKDSDGFISNGSDRTRSNDSGESGNSRVSTMSDRADSRDIDDSDLGDVRQNNWVNDDDSGNGGDADYDIFYSDSRNRDYDDYSPPNNFIAGMDNRGRYAANPLQGNMETRQWGDRDSTEFDEMRNLEMPRKSYYDKDSDNRLDANIVRNGFARFQNFDISTVQRKYSNEMGEDSSDSDGGRAVESQRPNPRFNMKNIPHVSQANKEITRVITRPNRQKNITPGNIVNMQPRQRNSLARANTFMNMLVEQRLPTNADILKSNQVNFRLKQNSPDKIEGDHRQINTASVQMQHLMDIGKEENRFNNINEISSQIDTANVQSDERNNFRRDQKYDNDDDDQRRNLIMANIFKEGGEQIYSNEYDGQKRQINTINMQGGRDDEGQFQMPMSDARKKYLDELAQRRDKYDKYRDTLQSLRNINEF